MAFNLSEVVPWGRSYSEYVNLFALTAEDLTQSILGCGDGPAEFNAVLTKAGGQIISFDPLYAFSKAQISVRIDEVYGTVLEQLRNNQHEFVWNTITSVEALGQLRLGAMKAFLADYDDGLRQGRYVCGALPDLPFADQRFDLALCSHFLFLYSEQLSAEFHVIAIQAMCRVANEVRVFPLLELGGQTSRHLPVVLKALATGGYTTRIDTVPYEFQKGANQLLVIHKKQ